MSTSRPELTPRELELLAAYRGHDRSVRVMLANLGATRTELDTALSKAGEPFRRPASAAPARALRRRASFAAAAEADAQDARVLERRLQRLLSERIAELEDRSSPAPSADSDEVGKALALSVRTLATLRRSAASQDQGGTTDHDRIDTTRDDAPPRSLAALRDELYGHLQRIQDEEREGGGVEQASAGPERDGGCALPLADVLPPESAPSEH